MAHTIGTIVSYSSLGVDYLSLNWYCRNWIHTDYSKVIAGVSLGGTIKIKLVRLRQFEETRSFSRNFVLHLAMSVWLILTALLQVSLVFAAKKNCDIPQSFWCDTNETEALCHAETPCAKYNDTMWDRKLNLTLLYQPMCIHSKIIITKMIIPEIDKNLKDIVNVELIPYGNSLENHSMEFVCQYGEGQCEMIRYHACAIHFMPNVTEQLKPIGCWMSHDTNDFSPLKFYQSCMEEVGLDKEMIDKINECRNGPLSNQLLHKYEVEVDAFWPTDHMLTPWIVINGISTAHMQSSIKMLSKALCTMYRGPKVPKSCDLYINRKPTNDL